MSRPLVFISYSHKDEEWKELKKLNLRPKDGRPLGLTKNNEVTETQIDLDLTLISEEVDALIKKMVAPVVPRQSSPPADAASSYARVSTLPAPKLFVGRKEHLAAGS